MCGEKYGEDYKRKNNELNFFMLVVVVLSFISGFFCSLEGVRQYYSGHDREYETINFIITKDMKYILIEVQETWDFLFIHKNTRKIKLLYDNRDYKNDVYYYETGKPFENKIKIQQLVRGYLLKLKVDLEFTKMSEKANEL